MFEPYQNSQSKKNSTKKSVHSWAIKQIFDKTTNYLRTIGRRQGLARVIVKEAITLGLKFRIFGYMSRGESVPEVITTVWKRSKIGLTAIDASKHLKSNINFRPSKVFIHESST